MKKLLDDNPRVLRSTNVGSHLYVAMRSADRMHRIADQMAWVAVFLAAAIMIFIFVDIPF